MISDAESEMLRSELDPDHVDGMRVRPSSNVESVGKTLSEFGSTFNGESVNSAR